MEFRRVLCLSKLASTRRGRLSPIPATMTTTESIAVPVRIQRTGPNPVATGSSKGIVGHVAGGRCPDREGDRAVDGVAVRGAPGPAEDHGPLVPGLASEGRQVGKRVVQTC